MVPYNKNTELVPPSVARWVSSGDMQASIVLDQPGNVAYTNLDEISGKVVVRCSKSADVNSIIVKLEGESRTRLLSPVGPNGERPRPELEYHKILYKINTVFPPAEVLESRSHTSASKAAYTLPPGTHEYPWKFKLPFNNACSISQVAMPKLGVSNKGVEIMRPATIHVRKTLPPTLTGFPGEAEIRYFVKATIARNSIFKENPRAYVPFNFFPIEPPRPPDTGSQVYARQKHAFNAFPEGDWKTGKMRELLGKKPGTPSPAIGDAISVSVDARLPEPAILTCNQRIPLSIIVKKLNSRIEVIHLQSLQIALIGNTKIRAHEVHRTESNSWIIMSKSNMDIRIGSENDPEGTETLIDNSLWSTVPLPNTVAPSFETCNISRDYQLDVRVGLSYAGTGSSGAGKPQTIVLPLRLITMVYSGIAPPPQVLERMAQARADIHSPNRASTMSAMTADNKLGAGADAKPSLPARPAPAASQPPPTYDEAPPSYEDAIATDIAPVDAPRPDYAPPPPNDDDDVLRRDEKRGWV